MHTIQENTDLLTDAAKRGDAIEVERLIPLSDPKDNDSLALRWAVENGHVECVKLLMPVSDPKVRDSEALQRAARKGHTQCVQLLIPVSAPKTRDSYALRGAVLRGHNDCVDLLFDVSDSDRVLEKLQKDLPNHSEWQYLEDKITAQKQHQRLSQETSYVSSIVKPRKI